MQFRVLICELKPNVKFKIPIRHNKTELEQIPQSPKRGGLHSVRGGGVRCSHPRQESSPAVPHDEGRGR